MYNHPPPRASRALRGPATLTHASSRCLRVAAQDSALTGRATRERTLPGARLRYKIDPIMNETPDAYIARILSFVGDQEPLQILASTAGRLRAAIAGRTRDALAWTPDPARWSATQILAHLADAEVVAAWRLRSIIAANGVPLQPFDQNAWAATFRYAESDPFEALQLFEVNRAATLSLLRRVDPALHANHGMHAERGKETVAHLLRLYAGHDLNHLAQIEKLVVGNGSRR